jgi:hypothetical protein
MMKGCENMEEKEQRVKIATSVLVLIITTLSLPFLTGLVGSYQMADLSARASPTSYREMTQSERWN